LLEALQRAIHFDAAALHRLDNDVLVPVASVGLSDDAMGRRFPIKDYPRLQIISRSRKPVVFPSDCALPDPFDGLLACDQGSFMRVHACLGCPLWVGDSLIGVFTADAAEPGKFEVANGGTLFLDEIGDLPLSVQPKLLRAIQYSEIQRVGSAKVIRADVRLIAATNRDLEEEVREGRFRADLFHRLNVYPLRVPPLRERVEDIPLLAGYFCQLARRRLGLGPVRLAPETIPALKRYGWPGNVRELENVISRATLKASASASRSEPVVITVHHLGAEFEIPAEGAQGGPITSQGDAPVGVNLREATRAYQRALIRRALEQSGGNWAKAALVLGMHRSNLHHLIVRLGLK
jgi:anaerobic nitric oxide reductase transcription regulator